MGGNPDVGTPAELSALGSHSSFHDRFLQKLAVSCIMVNIIGPFVWWPIILFLAWLHPYLAVCVASYLFYIFVIDSKAHTLAQGATPIRRCRSKMLSKGVPYSDACYHVMLLTLSASKAMLA